LLGHQHCPDEIFTSPVNYFSKFRGIVCTFSKNGMTTHAVVLFPEVFTPDNLGSDIFGFGLFGNFSAQ
jgi:hypothetical protein